VSTLDCVEFVTLVDDLIDLQPPSWPSYFEQHLRDCPPCAQFLKQMLDLQLLLRLQAPPALQPGDPDLERIMNLLLKGSES